MARMRFGLFIAPHHPVGEHPTLQFERDLQLIEQFDQLGYDEVWVGEHHSGGWETIGHPELFLAAAAQRTHRIRLGTGVTSLPYHHPYNVAGRIALLDHLSRGRAILGTGPGRAALRRPHVRHRPGQPAGAPGRVPGRRHPAAAQRRAGHA